MSILKKYLSNIILILFEIFVGVLLIIDYKAFTTSVIIFFGIVLMIIGLISLIKYFIDRRHDEESVMNLIWAGLSVLFGAFAAFAAPFIFTLFYFILIMYALIMVISGAIKIYGYVMARKSGNKLSVLVLISAIISIALGIFIAFNPFESAELIWGFIAASLIFEAVIDLAAIITEMILGRRNTPGKTQEYIEAEVEE